MNHSTLLTATFEFQTKNGIGTVIWEKRGPGKLKGYDCKCIYKITIYNGEKGSWQETGLKPNVANSLFFLKHTK